MRLASASLAALVLAAAGCGGGSADGDGPTVVASLYPLAWAAGRIAPAGTDVVNLTPPGAEPHDVELSPGDVADIVAADLVLYVGGGFQPALEDALEGRDGPSLDVRGAASDPHVWLDGATFRGVVESIGEALGRPDAAGELVRQLEELDAAYRSGLARCERREIVTSHAAFGSLAAAYGLRQIALVGTSPEAEPGPRELERLIAAVEESGATTVFSEPLLSDRLAQTVARETGAEVAVLDPVEGLTEHQLDEGEDYLTVMHRNLATLRQALGCT